VFQTEADIEGRRTELLSEVRAGDGNVGRRGEYRIRKSREITFLMDSPPMPARYIVDFVDVVSSIAAAFLLHAVEEWAAATDNNY
jgi:hypothetical protein